MVRLASSDDCNKMGTNEIGISGLNFLCGIGGPLSGTPLSLLSTTISSYLHARDQLVLRLSQGSGNFHVDYQPQDVARVVYNSNEKTLSVRWY